MRMYLVKVLHRLYLHFYEPKEKFQMVKIGNFKTIVEEFNIRVHKT